MDMFARSSSVGNAYGKRAVVERVSSLDTDILSASLCKMDRVEPVVVVMVVMVVMVMAVIVMVVVAIPCHFHDR